MPESIPLSQWGRLGADPARQGKESLTGDPNNKNIKNQKESAVERDAGADPY